MESKCLKILVTGATGFVGTPLIRHLSSQGHQVIGALRSAHLSDDGFSGVEFKAVGDIHGSLDWMNYLVGVDAVVHLANRAHVMHESNINPLALYRSINTEGTLQLARQSAASGIKRFIFISSVKVNGGSTLPGQRFSPVIESIPTDSYGLSKYEAEEGLKKISLNTGMEVVIIRPPLVYGPGVKANFLKMMQWVEKGIPLPMGHITNQRSLLGIDNLLDFIQVCLTHPKAVDQTFLISDDHDVSTTELLKEIASAMHRPARLLEAPQLILEKSLILLGQGHIAERLCGSLRLDITLAKTLLSWKPPYSFKDQLRKTVSAYLSDRLSQE
jgi:nucleoside-diphosphate-sugar epimerase